MVIKFETKHFLKVLLVLTWILFVGLCVEAGGILFNLLYTLYRNPNEATYFWDNVNLSSLLAYDKSFFIVLTVLMTIVATLKAIMFYFILHLFYNKKFNIEQPFHLALKNFISYMAYFALAIGLFSYWGTRYNDYFIQNGVTMPELQDLKFAGADVWIFMGIVLLVISQIVKRGVELQTENDLTI